MDGQIDGWMEGRRREEKGGYINNKKTRKLYFFSLISFKSLRNNDRNKR